VTSKNYARISEHFQSEAQINKKRWVVCCANIRTTNVTGEKHAMLPIQSEKGFYTMFSPTTLCFHLQMIRLPFKRSPLRRVPNRAAN